jgi:hypothetical protein
MLVVVALMVLMMTIIVQIFSAATGAVSASKVYQGLDDELRELDATIRQDLQGVTARVNPPIDPDENLGYFEYIENSWPDVQGEDTDDCIRFTAQAPPNQPFTGRMYVFAKTGNPTLAQLAKTQPITITSEFAEIIYFLRNGNLYRRVLLVAPELQSTVNYAWNANVLMTKQPAPLAGLPSVLFSGSWSWQGLNDLSTHPSPVALNGQLQPPVLNTLGDLTNRENRAFSPRFASDYAGPGGTSDGVPDDFNFNSILNTITGDGVPDYYPTLYPGVFATGLINVGAATMQNTCYQTTPTSGPAAYQFFPFPYIYPGAYSQPDPTALTATSPGWIHVLDPTGNTFNHAPLDTGDSLPGPTTAAQFQTWWGFPTWRETASKNWHDPWWQINYKNQGQPLGLQPFNPKSAPSPVDPNLLPPLAGPPFGPLQLFSEGAGSFSFADVYAQNPVAVPPVPNPALWEDDLLMTGVRSFDVKAYDNTVSSYVDLGNSPANNINTNPAGYLFNNVYTKGFPSLGVALSALQSLGHEGRIPPLPQDFRFDPQAQSRGIFTNVGDAGNSAANPVIRLRRVWDSWSTEYTEAPASGYDPGGGSLASAINPTPPYGLDVFPPGTTTLASSGYAACNPVYPSYPPPYPVPLRGLQIQIRVVDPRNERIKVVTIRQDFSEKIYKKR